MSDEENAIKNFYISEDVLKTEGLKLIPNEEIKIIILPEDTKVSE